MKNVRNKAVWFLLSSSLVVASCDKDDTGELAGNVPQPSFTASTPRSIGLTTEVIFTSTGPEAFLYQWDFGDGTVATGKTVTHIYKKSGTVKAQLIASYREGTGLSEVKDVVLPQNVAFVKQLLTGTTGTKIWMLDNTADAPIIVGTEKNPAEYYAGGKAGTLPACQADDEFTFTSADVFTYNAKAETYVAATPATATSPAVPAACGAPRSGNSDFTFGPAVGDGFAMLEFKKAGTFIGVTDAPDLTYRIIDITADRMILRAGKPNGTVFQMKLVAKP
ncbi:PKD domain-containing protein [Hymenobacter sp. 5516J-16]|uniref:PKD domain-containing protein n=1 Tax=Hymenobacter sp. 5516J-16 TaxID=2932253 RepID=UPI001FD611AA|nr:PKD domain-containing protein [Hymenobacter sp. 5516J-16]UOQ75376.1 PKD domain-containing protein [Hymenobacter sp. 5516J-16]